MARDKTNTTGTIPADFPNWFDKELNDALGCDNKEKFLSVIDWKLHIFRTRPQQILRDVISSCAVKCAEALITGQTPLTVDLNLPCCPRTGAYPIHLIALKQIDAPSITELILYYGARTDIRYAPISDNTFGDYSNMLTLQMALRQMFVFAPEFQEWIPKHSIYKLVILFCLPRMQNLLETIGLLAWTTKETEEVFLELAMQGKVIELAALLIVAHKKVYNVMDRVCKCFDSIEINYSPSEEGQGEKVASIQQLFELFIKAGDDISAYVKKDKFYVRKDGALEYAKIMLERAGFHLEHSDTNFRDYTWFTTEYCHFNGDFPKAPYDGLRCLNDFGMAHYSKSGYRWKVSKKDPWWKYLNLEAHKNELKNEVEVLKKENGNIKKKEQQLSLSIWMDDELVNILKEDEKKEFLSVINCKFDFFRSRAQQLLYVVCVSGSIKCAEALLKGETPLSVDLNLPCTDTGMYPLHCAALSFFPSITELFLHYGARTDTRFTACNPSNVFPEHLLEAHTNKLPLHTALQGISRYPCTSEWTPKHSIYKLVTLLCLPRMQNPLETLGLLVGTTEDIENEFTQLARDEKIVELAAMLMVAYKRLDGVVEEVYGWYISIKESLLLNEDNQMDKVESVLQLVRVFKVAGDDIVAYVKEDKYNVTKHESIRDVTCLLKGKGFPLEFWHTDLSVYSWYQNEECSYPSEAPYENARILHDVGMTHYSKSRFRWKVSEKNMDTWWRAAKRKAYIKQMENEIKLLKEENAKAKERQQQELKPAAFGCPYILRLGVPIASSFFFSNDAVKNKMPRSSPILKNLMRRGMASMALPLNLRNLPSRSEITSMALVLKQIMKFM